MMLLAACGGTDEPAIPAGGQEMNKTVVISGTVTNPKTQTVSFRMSTDPVLSGSEVMGEAELDSSGAFSVSFDLEAPTYMTFKNSNESSAMYVSPGDELNITIDTDQFDETIKYSGTGAERNNYLAARYLMEEEMGQGQKFWEVAPEKYIAWSDSFVNVKTSWIGEQLKDAPDFMAMEQEAVVLNANMERLRYPRYFEHYNKDVELVLPEDFYAFIDDIEFKEDASITRSYLDMIGSLIDRKYSEYKETNPDAEIEYLGFAFDKAKEMLPASTQEKFMAYRLGSKLKYEGIEGSTSDAMDRFKADFASSEYMEELNEMYAQWEAISAGKAAPVFTASTLEGESVSLADFKGSLVYVDVWATWCGPCKAELPHLEELQEEMAGKNITFVSVSIDEDKPAWEAMVQEKEMKGVQLWIEDAWDSALNDSYNIRSIPRFLLIDAEGNIVDATAPRPSSGDKIKELIEANLPAS